MKKRPAASRDVEYIREQAHRQTLSSMSHDLKTPLATIIGALEIYLLMNAKLTTEKRKTLVDSALKEAHRLDNFISNILDMARLDSGMVKAQQISCNLALLMDECVVRMQSKHKKCDIILHPLEGSMRLATDAKLLHRAIGLLLENAVKHAGKHPVIEVEYGIEQHHAVVRVRDHGPGIPRGMEEAIFSKFTRIAKSDKQKAGTGLGLAICQRIMQTLGGNVQAENHAHGGALFTLMCPTGL